MTDKVVEPSVSAEESAMLANEWVSHLKRQSKLRFAMLAVVSVGLVASSGVLVKTIMDKNALNLELSAKGAMISQFESDVELKSAQIAELEGKLEKVQERVSFLEQVKGDTASQLGIAEQIIDTQKQKIALIEQEFTESTRLVSDLESQVSKANSRADTLQNTLNSKQKELNQRSAAYDAIVNRQKDTRLEVDRLVLALEEAENARKASQQRLAAVQGQLASSNKDVSRLKSELDRVNAELQAQEVRETQAERVANNHQNLAIQPIIGQAAPESSKTKTFQSNASVVDPNALMIE